MTGHKHAEVLRAIADGKEVQVKGVECGWFTTTTLNPLSEPGYEWRVKPEPKPDMERFVHSYPSGMGNLFIEQQAAIRSMGGMATGFLRMTFDGETGKLKSAEVI